VYLLMQAVRHPVRALKDGNLHVKSALKSAAEYGVYLLNTSTFNAEVKGSAGDIAMSARKQTSAALKKPVDTDLGNQEESLFDATVRKSKEQMDLSIQRAEDVYDIWDELPEDAEDFEDEDALEERLNDGLSGVEGGALAAASMYYAWTFGQMIQEAQTDAGVSEYVWLSMRDSHTRPEHEALDGEIASWDDPPLKAEDSSIGKDCHAGEDANCRCVASPIDPEEGLDNKQQDRVRN
jgi:SPP1 gp7 family putative phage head morphogenesis protein